MSQPYNAWISVFRDSEDTWQAEIPCFGYTVKAKTSLEGMDLAYDALVSLVREQLPVRDVQKFTFEEQRMARVILDGQLITKTTLTLNHAAIASFVMAFSVLDQRVNRPPTQIYALFSDSTSGQ